MVAGVPGFTSGNPVQYQAYIVDVGRGTNFSQIPHTNHHQGKNFLQLLLMDFFNAAFLIYDEISI